MTASEDSAPGFNRCVILKAVKTIELPERPVPTIQDAEVLIKVMRTGICGSDIYCYNNLDALHRMVLGHQSDGLIAQIGNKVTDQHVGQKVVIEPGFFCKSGCGPLGLIAMKVAKSYGVAKIIAFDIEPARVEFAKSYFMEEHKLAYGVDDTIDATGAEVCLQMAVLITKP
ncbi:hypothetical protein SEUCBS139899_007872 [Sporothrix eucalyptigena]|uniref:Alcohol dehydrogenase-like N-terminal domain-containing protein n=1 Tax=Sporothrix eucalyptigena TaxID=1812306 RepID=A0ABP0C8Z5_9PEZI